MRTHAVCNRITDRPRPRVRAGAPACPEPDHRPASRPAVLDNNGSPGSPDINPSLEPALHHSELWIVVGTDQAGQPKGEVVARAPCDVVVFAIASCSLNGALPRDSRVTSANAPRTLLAAIQENRPSAEMFVLATIPLGYYIEGGGGDGLITQWLYAVGWIVLALAVLHRGLPVIPGDVIWVLWLAVMLAAPIWNQSTDFLVIQAVRFLIVGIGTMLFCRAFVPDREKMAQLFGILLLGGLGVGALVLFDYLASSTPTGTRFTYRSVHPVPLSMLGATVVLLAYLHYSFRRIGVMLFSVAGTVGGGLMIISASKGPLAALLATVVLLIPMTIRRLGLPRVAVVVGLIAAVTRVEQFDTLTRRIINAGADASTAARLTSYRDAVDAWERSPLFGSGVTAGHYPHNVLLEVLANHGIVLASLLMITLLFIATKYARLITSATDSDFVTVATYGILIMSVVSLMVSWTYLDHKLLFVGLGLALNLHLIGRSAKTRLTL